MLLVFQNVIKITTLLRRLSKLKLTTALNKNICTLLTALENLIYSVSWKTNNFFSILF